MIRFVHHADIDPKRWDDTILQSAFPTLFCTFNLLDILTGKDTWHALILDDYAYVMPLPARSKMGIHYVYSPFFISQIGIFSKKPVSAQIVSDFLNALPKSFKHIDLLMNTTNDTSFIQAYTTELISHQLLLHDSYDTLFQHYRQNIKRNLKSAHKQQLSTSINQLSVEDIVRLFRENRGKQKEVHYQVHDYVLLLEAASYLQTLNCLEISGVHTSDGTPIAGALFVHDHNRYLFWFSGRDKQYADAKPMFFLLDEFIRKHALEKCLLDFNGSMNDNVARLYRGFGGQPYTISMINHSKQKQWQLLLKLYHLIRG